MKSKSLNKRGGAARVGDVADIAMRSEQKGEPPAGADGVRKAKPNEQDGRGRIWLRVEGGLLIEPSSEQSMT